MDKNNNIEDFFNNSMDQFNDSPPDFVWDGINNRLDKKPPFYQNIRLWAALAIVTVLGLMAAFYIYTTQKEIAELNHTISSLEENNIILEDGLIECGSNSEKLVHIINAYSFDEVKETPEKEERTVIKPTKKINAPILNEENIIPSQYEQHPIQNKLSPKLSNPENDLNRKNERENVIPSQLTEDIDSIIQENPELIEKGQTIEVPIFSVQETEDTASIEVDKMKPNIKGSFKDWFQKKKEKLEFRKRIREKREKREDR